jgi:5-formyltetrahydrofolate cyclo-ligase
MDASAAATEKARLRRLVWQRLEAAGAARFPHGSGRIPNFEGATPAAQRLATLPEWQNARVLKCNPDYAQAPLRKLALRQGKLVYMAVPRLHGDKPFIVLDPAILGRNPARAATIAGAEKLGRPVAPEDMQPIDAVICGAVAVRPDGARLGKGGGFSDLELAVVRSLGLVTETTPVMTTVHSIQVLDEPIPMLPHDIALTHFATPDAVYTCLGHPGLVEGRIGGLPTVQRHLLNEEQRAIPLLQRLMANSHAFTRPKQRAEPALLRSPRP